MMIGFFEGLDSERGIAWRLADSLTLREFLSIALDEKTPDHVTISRTRRLIDGETHQNIFGWVLERLAQSGLIKGKTVGVDSTTLEANAAMKSIVRRDTGESCMEYLKRLAEAEAIEAKDSAALLRMDRKRKKKTSNEDWQSPVDGDAEVTKLKDGRTALAYKAENAVDMETGAIIAVTTHSGAAADTATVIETVMEAGVAVADLLDEKTPISGTTARRVVSSQVAVLVQRAAGTPKVVTSAGCRRRSEVHPVMRQRRAGLLLNHNEVLTAYCPTVMVGMLLCTEPMLT
jgi:hypothetical protein